MSFAAFFALAGFLILAARLAPALGQQFHRREKNNWPEGEAKPFVSVIIPARNEEANLPRLFSSIGNLTWRSLEVIIVDDQSTDRTSTLCAEFAQSHPQLQVKVVSGQARPEEWTGKSWACHQGFLQAKGDYLLFTDADTAHEPTSIEAALATMKIHDLNLLSAVPFHISETTWEKLLGPFQTLLLVTTGAFSKPKPNRVFAIGQYLLFERAWYIKQDGHNAVKKFLCEDLELAANCLKMDGRYRVEFKAQLFSVRMYATFSEFIRGWRRNFRLGFKHARIWAPLEIFCVIAALTANFRFFWSGPDLSLTLLLSLAMIFDIQRKLGQFSFWGVILYPFSLAVFVAVSLLALKDLVLQKQYSWRGREYKVTAD